MSELDRRRIVKTATGIALFGGMGLMPGTLSSAAAQTGGKEQMEAVTPPEDLMREHGVLNRVLIIYETTVGKFSSNESFDPAILTQSAQIIRQFIHEYHERNEETQVFPRFRKANQLLGLVNILYQQHQAGRRLTDTILQLAPAGATAGDERMKLTDAVASFIRMYRPHEAREDTVLFPKIRSVVSANEFASMGEDFEKDERQRFGQDGFEMMVDRVAGLERALGIDDLAKFTPAS